VAGSALVAALTGPPEPAVHDEFAYLLAADTYASGRITNPPHPMWEHFESIHVIQQPSYMAKYPPGQGLLLAAGQVTTGRPLAGVWLGVGLMCGAICWMLLGWLPYRWALLGSALVLLQLGLLGYWAQSYWGGALAAAGGALLFGGLRRLLERQGPKLPSGSSWGPGLAIGLGMAVLAITRPFEAVVVSLPTALLLFQGLVRAPARRSLLLGGILPAAAVVALTVAALAYGNWRVTGNVMRTPYAEYTEAYDPSYIFALWKPATAPRPQRHQVFADMEKQWYFERHTKLRTLSGFLAEKKKVADVSIFLLGPLIVVLAFVPLAMRDRWVRIALAICASMVIANLLIPWTFIHYFAPITSLAFFLAVTGLREAERAMGGPSSPKRGVGHGFVVFVVLLSVAFFVKSWVRQAKAEPDAWPERRTVLEELTVHRGDQLVLVRYAEGHRWNDEWVYNAADIDAAPIVWARYLDEASNRKLLSYFAGRRAWVLEVDSTATLTPLTR